MVQISKGEKRTYRVPAFTGLDWNITDILVHQFRGSTPGPSVYVGASTHGNEFQGVEICRQLAMEIDPSVMHGNLTIVPVQNPIAFQNRVRLNPIDGKDLDLVYPGRNEGTATEKLAAVLFSEFASKADCVIDLHSGGICSKNIPHIYVPSDSAEIRKFSSMELASAFGADVLIDTKKVGDFHFALENLSPFYCNKKLASAGLYVELGEGFVVDDYHVQFGKRGVLNVLRKMGILEGRIERQGKLKVVQSTKVITSETSGLMKLRYELGQHIRKGDLIVEVYDIYGGVENIYSPTSGIVQWSIRFGNVCAGEHICWIGENPTDYQGRV